MTEKRGRGRPAGTEINDEAALAKVADLRVASPKIKLSAALKTVRMAGEHKGQSARAVEERWRTKFNARRAALIEAATKRKAAKEARPTSGGGAYHVGMGFSTAPNTPIADVMARATASPTIADVMARATANPLQDAIGTTRNSVQEAVNALQRYTTPMHDAAQRATDQFRMAYGQVGYEPTGMYETMRRIDEQQSFFRRIEEQQRFQETVRRIEEQQRLMNQINIINRYPF
jgi:hypothetical protein